MPRLPKSKGTIRFTTPNVDEFQRFMFFELANLREWNKDQIIRTYGVNRWSFQLVIDNELRWTIQFTGTEVVCVSNEPIIYLRKGLIVSMGRAELVVAAQ